MTDARKDADRGASPPREVSPWALAGLGMQFVVALLCFVYAGNWVDARFHTAPVGLLVGVFVGGGGSFVLGVRRIMRQS
ncbi:MAG: AtpZ/AtpI family protein [Gemmatimonadaceae bacterium]